MRTYYDCLPCFMRQALDVVKIATSDPLAQEELLRRIIRCVSDIDLSASPPAMATEIHRIVKRVTGKADPYLRIKQRCNGFALEMYPSMKNLILESEDPLATALRLSIAGNIIDFGVGSPVAEEAVHETVNASLDAPLDEGLIENFKKQIAQADSIVYLGDNAGEIVFDRLFIEQLPAEKITFVVRGEPVINDITIDDARAVGLDEIVSVIDNGWDAPGTILERCSAELVEKFNSADLVISKGQGNFETLSDESRNIFYLLKAKCPVVASHLNCSVGDFMFFNPLHAKVTE